jgi:hypothetical protein
MEFLPISSTLLYKNSQSFQVKWHHLGGSFGLDEKAGGGLAASGCTF